MIIDNIPGDILRSDAKNIAFAVNSEGYNDAGFAGVIAYRFWNELEKCGQNEIGTVLTKTVGDKTFYALVCHSLKNGWGDNQAEIIKKCFDSIESDEPIHTIAIGTGLVGMLTGANFGQIVCGMHDSKNEVVLHSFFTLEQIMNAYTEEKTTWSLQRKRNNKIS